MSNRHGARRLSYQELHAGLLAAEQAGLVSSSRNESGLSIWCYTKATVYERQWSEYTRLARGLILDEAEKRIVATPFEKFFNIGETADPIPDLPFEVFEKLDGSLVILHWHQGEWKTATKGSFGSQQAIDAASWLSPFDLTSLDTETTYLLEWIAPHNRIVVHYHHTGLVLLGAYRGDGSEMSYDELLFVGERLGWRIAKRHSFSAVSELLALAKTLPPTEEGFVLRFSNGLRLKVKGDEYCRIHRMVSRLTPLALWEAMQAGDDLDAVRRQLPEEFWADFDNIIVILQRHIDELVAFVKAQADAVVELSDKEVGLRLNVFPAEVRRFIFPYRKAGGDLLSGRTRDLVFRSIRPDGNRLAGYAPSTAMNRVMDEAG